MDPLLSFLLFLAVASAAEMIAAGRVRWRTWFGLRVSITRLLSLGIVYGFWLAALQRPVLAVVCGLLTVGVFVTASRAKQTLLQEPLVFLDLQFIGQVFRHPSLYYGQILLSPRNLVLLAGSLGAIAALLTILVIGEHALAPPLPAAWVTLLLLGPLLLWLGPRWPGAAPLLRRMLPAPTHELDPVEATAQWGLFVPMFAHYGRWIAEGQKPRTIPPEAPFISDPAADLPHIVAVQCESFVDPARFFRHPPELPAYRRTVSSAAASGPLRVPAGGAYTMRAEFAFLTGRTPEELGCDRYNPYARAERHDDPSLAKTLARAGYTTRFVHPHDLRFFRRDIVMPTLGFRHLHGPNDFRHAERCGPYVSDAAVADHVVDLLAGHADPQFVFAVTMENHGPWMPGRRGLPQDNARELYLAHLRNSDRMIDVLLASEGSIDRPVVICFYGDHAPVLNYDFDVQGTPLTDYFISARCASDHPQQGQTRAIHDLADVLLGLWQETCTRTTVSRRAPAVLT